MFCSPIQIQQISPDIKILDRLNGTLIGFAERLDKYFKLLCKARQSSVMRRWSLDRLAEAKLTPSDFTARQREFGLVQMVFGKASES